LLGLIFIPSAFAGIINLIFLTKWGNIISLPALMINVTAGLFGTFNPVAGVVQIRDFDDNVAREILLTQPPLWCCWAALFIISVVCLALLHWKVKAYEVVR